MENRSSQGLGMTEGGQGGCRNYEGLASMEEVCEVRSSAVFLLRWGLYRSTHVITGYRHVRAL